MAWYDTLGEVISRLPAQDASGLMCGGGGRPEPLAILTCSPEPTVAWALLVAHRSVSLASRLAATF